MVDLWVEFGGRLGNAIVELDGTHLGSVMGVLKSSDLDIASQAYQVFRKLVISIYFLGYALNFQ